MDKVIQLILFCQFVFVRGTPPVLDFIPDQNFPALHGCLILREETPSEPVDSLRLGIIRDSGSILRVNLKRTTRVLANENLPVWTLTEKSLATYTVDDKYGRLERNNEVMKQLGEFTAYQEPETSSAAIYFHKRREFDGMIGYELLIQNLLADKLHPKRETLLAVGGFGVYNRPNFMKHDDNGDFGIDDPGAGVNDQKQIKTYEGHLYEGYPEVLVIVSWDVANDWTQNVKKDDFYTTIVSQVLILFNGVDMLYSKLEKTKIQINIAGIIIASNEKSLYLLRRCYHPYRSETGHIGYWMDGGCVNPLLRLYLRNHIKEIPLDSYDLAIFLTREDLFKGIQVDDQNQLTRHVLGVASIIDDIYEFRKSGHAVILVGSVTSREYLENYSTIAHEMAHLMTVRHDRPVSSTQEERCCGHLMKTVGRYCNKCLSWSETSEETFYSFFSSPNCCEFINEPRSLHPPGPKLLLTTDEQCRCYGYESARKFTEVLNNFCRIDLQCVRVNGQFHKIALPMDGTPCRNGKVCWQKRCSKLESPGTALIGNEVELQSVFMEAKIEV